MEKGGRRAPVPEVNAAWLSAEEDRILQPPTGAVIATSSPSETTVNRFEVFAWFAHGANKIVKTFVCKKAQFT